MSWRHNKIDMKPCSKRIDVWQHVKGHMVHNVVGRLGSSNEGDFVSTLLSVFIWFTLNHIKSIKPTNMHWFNWDHYPTTWLSSNPHVQIDTRVWLANSFFYRYNYFFLNRIALTLTIIIKRAKCEHNDIHSEIRNLCDIELTM